MKTFKLNILAANKPFFTGECESLILPTVDGEYGILVGHRNTIAAVIPGTLKFRVSGREQEFASVSEGLVKIEHGEVLVLVDTIERPEEINVNEAQEKLEQDREALLHKQSIEDFHATKARMARSLARLKTQKHVNINN